MLVLINAWKSIIRSIGRNLLVGIIVFTIAVSSCIALAIKQAAKDAETSGLNSVNVTGTITVDRDKIFSMATDENGVMREDSHEKIMEMMEQNPELSSSELKKYADSKYVKDYYYQISGTINGDSNFKPYTTEKSNSSENNNKMTEGGKFMVVGLDGDFNISGFSSEEAMNDFISGTSKITKGSLFDFASDEYAALISKELAAFNSLEVGDSFTLVNPAKEDETYQVKVQGIYETSSPRPERMFFSAMDPLNQIILNTAAMEKIIDNSASNAVPITDSQTGEETSSKINGMTNGTFVFDNKESYDKFSAEARSKGLSENYTINSPDVENYEASLLPMKNLSNFANTLLLIILGVGAVILIVLNMFNIRERKFEVGVLTAIGIKKWKVASQFVVELLAVTLFAMMIGTAVGAVASVPVSNKLLESQISAQEESSATQNQNFGRPGGPSGKSISIGGPGARMKIGGANEPVSYVDTINATVGVGILGNLVGIGIILTIISSLVGVIFVLRYEPLKILANRA